MGSITPSKPDYGHRLLPTTIDDRAKNEPELIWCSLPHDDADLSQGYEDITYTKLANAINQISWLMHEKFGPSTNFETLAYMGTPDIRYHILEVAAAKTGYKVLFSSHMNSLDGHMALFEKTGVTGLLCARGVKVDDILAAKPLRCEFIPELDELLAGEQVEVYPYDKTFDEAKDEPFVILHTSGSTGAPKPIEYTLGSVSALDHHGSFPDIDPASGLPIRFFFTNPGRQERMLVPFLHFHGIASVATMVGAVFGKLIYVPGFRHRSVSTNDVFEILEHSGVTTAFFSPAMVEELARHPDVGRYISRLGKCLYGGAPITDTAGQTFSQYTHLQSQWGITETGKLIDLETEPEDFGYCAFDTKHSGMDFVPVAPDLYEMLVRRNDDSLPNTAVFWRCPDLDVFRPGDLWSPHPDPKKAKYVWRYRGRTDDLITGKDGINFHPTAWEGRHSEHDAVRAAIIAGTGYRQPLLLLELHSPPASEDEEREVLERIWTESISPINDMAPSNGKIARTHVIVASAGKPFERSVKGTVARKATIRDYEVEIAKVYEIHGDRSMVWNERL